MKMKMPTGSSDEGYYGQESNVISYVDDAETEPDIPGGENGDFSEYLWMVNEEEFDKQVMEQLEEEEMMEECLEAMLAEEIQHQRNQTSVAWCNAVATETSGNALSQQMGSLRVRGELAKSSTLNPDAAEFVPSLQPSVGKPSEVSTES